MLRWYLAQGKLVFFWFHSASWYRLCLYVPFLPLRTSLEVGAALGHLFFSPVVSDPSEQALWDFAGSLDLCRGGFL